MASFLASSKMALAAYVRSWWKQPHEQPDTSCPLLDQMPVELIDCIADFLAPADKVLLALTCRAMRACLGQHSDAARLSRAEYFTYLAGMARALPEQWVCDYCMTLHPINKYDKPTTLRRPCSCPRYDTRALWRRSRVQNGRHIGIEHHHVQLALKYTRLKQQKYDSYLQSLLEPYQNEPFDTLGRGNITHEVRYSAYPRIVTGRDGNPRLLLLSIWKYLAGGRDIMVRNIGRQRICPHLQFFDWDYPSYSNNLLQTFQWALGPGNRGTEWRSVCARCATDFSVMLRDGNLYLQVWQDFGPEGSPLDLTWRSQNVRPGLDGAVNSALTGPTLHHQPGSIEELYGPTPQRLPVPDNRSPWVYFVPQFIP
ncbi:hypothetical protein O1611_g7016 [Lasiodiplodia mahajangana]|uniref:Uncharacterized protein n=1 Tax=Lasiodiplodia mahajangana TaxID=1108764 RepID=A0ACC2JHC5_9PEZI|nr:hypothetical protein O1611_g7016 [Lasiodiplodia mahajangana]